MKKIKDNRCSAVVEIRYPKRNLEKEISVCQTFAGIKPKQSFTLHKGTCKECNSNKQKITINITYISKRVVFIEIPKANIKQGFLIEDISNLIKDLPDLIK